MVSQDNGDSIGPIGLSNAIAEDFYSVCCPLCKRLLMENMSLEAQEAFGCPVAANEDCEDDEHQEASEHPSEAYIPTSPEPEASDEE